MTGLPLSEFSVAVIVPFYNRSRFLERLIQSVKKQTFLPEKLLIIDNGSTFEEAKEAWGIIQQESKHSVFEIAFISTLKKGNANYARNLGIALSNTDYVAFIDSDDWWERSHLERSLQKLVSTQKAGVYSGAIIHKEIKIFNSSADVNDFDSPLEFIFSKKGYIAQTSSYVVNKKAISDAKITWNPDLKRHQDYDFFLSIYYQTNGWCYSNFPASNVDWSNGGAKKDVDFKSMVRFLKSWEEYFPRKVLGDYVLSQIAMCEHVGARKIYKNYYRTKLLKLAHKERRCYQLASIWMVELKVAATKILEALHLKGLIRRIF